MCFFRFSLIDVADKGREEISRESHRAHQVLEKTQRAAEKREKHMKDKLGAAEKQVRNSTGNALHNVGYYGDGRCVSNFAGQFYREETGMPSWSSLFGGTLRGKLAYHYEEELRNARYGFSFSISLLNS